MKIVDNIEMLEIPMKLMGTTGTIYPTVIWDDEHVVLIRRRNIRQYAIN